MTLGVSLITSSLDPETSTQGFSLRAKAVVTLMAVSMCRTWAHAQQGSNRKRIASECASQRSMRLSRDTATVFENHDDIIKKNTKHTVASISAHGVLCCILISTHYQ